MADLIKVGDKVKILESLYFGVVVKELPNDVLRIKPTLTHGASFTGNFHWDIHRYRVVKVNAFWEEWQQWYKNQEATSIAYQTEEKNEPSWEKWDFDQIWQIFQKMAHDGSLKENDCLQCYQIYQKSSNGDITQWKERLDYILAVGMGMNDHFLDKLEKKDV